MTSTTAALRSLPASFQDRSSIDRRPAPGLDRRPPWHDVPIYPGRDLANDDLWRLSLALAHTKREVARQPPCLPRARKASLSLVLAAVAAAAPALSSAHVRSGSKPGIAAASNGRNALLELGAKGRAVAQVQRALGITVDGIFGPETRRAVRAFQRAAGLEPDGIVGPLTRAALGLGGAAATLERGDRGPAVEQLQRLLGIAADGVFGPRTLRAVRAFQRHAGLVVDGIVGPLTRAALASHGGAAAADGAGAQPPSGDEATPAAPEGIHRSLATALRLGREMGLTLISGHRSGATIAASGNRSDHSYYPSKAIDMRGTSGQMRRYARAVAGLPGVETVIYSGVGIWLHGQGWGPIRSSVTVRDHRDHVHVDTF